MTTYTFDVSSEAAVTREILEAVDDAAALRQAILLMSEILRDHALGARDHMNLCITVCDAAGRPIWSGAAAGQAGRPLA